VIRAETNFYDLTDLDHGSRQHFFGALKFEKIARDSIHRSNPWCTKRGAAVPLKARCCVHAPAGQ
jgi:hypothetical protein